MADVVIARRSVVVRVGDSVHRVRRRRTLAHAEARIVAEHPELWEPLPVDFPADVKPKAPPRKRAAQG